MAGSITATSGTIGGFTISASDITATNLSLVSGAANTARITVGTGANLAGMNSGNAAGDIALWAGATFANRATAPFRVEMDGDLTASSVNITGGTIGAAPTINGTRADVLQPRAETIFKRQIFLGAKNDGLTESVFFGTGTITRNLILTKLDTGSAGVALSGDIWTSSDSSEINWDSNYEVVTSVRLGTTGTLHNVFIGINSSTASHSPTTGRHFGFIIDNASIVASNADGTTQTITSVSATVTSRNKYRIVKNGTTNIQFYINDTLVATHTTNLPTGTITPCLFLVIGQDYTPSGREIFIANGYSVIVDL
jgi:hypothetical protein